MSNTEEALLPFGVYYHPRKGFAIAEKPDVDPNCWDFQIDKNKTVKHPLIRARALIVSRGQGGYWMRKELKGYLYLGEL